jgi:hypothetical protein
METIKRIRWRWGVIAALAMTLLSLFPQCYLWWERGRQWNGNQAFFYTDEPAYAAYVNALIHGRPRRNDPYTGRDDDGAARQPESLFSIQFIPAYFLALPARALGLSTATAFILLTPLVAFLTSLVLFWVLALITNDDRAAAAFVPLVLCLGVLISGNGVVCAFLGRQTAFVYLPFLRRYVPAVAFPCFLLFFPFVWQAFTNNVHRQRLLYAVGAGIAFTICVYSYFYLWTAALFWLVLLALLWFFARPEGWRSIVSPLLVIAAFAIAGLIPYALLLFNRSPTMDTVQALERTHVPDLWRSIEVMALTIITGLVVALKRSKLDWRDPRFLITAAFALLPFVLFNQQVLTGRSLQPMHYEQFVANYTTLIALALTIVWLWRGRESKRHLPVLLVLIVGCISYAWGMGETWIATRRFAKANVIRDEARAVALRLRELPAADTTDQARSKVVFAPEFGRGDTLPMEAPQPVLWAPHMFVFSGVTVAENKERFFQFLYYSGVDAKAFESNYQHQGFAQFAIFGWERANQKLTANFKAITAEEIANEAKNYADYIANFDSTRATRPTLAYLLLDANQPIDLSNLERWYTRDNGERIGRYLLYRLTPRNQT